MNFKVKQLSECPEQLEVVGRWIFDQWWSRRYSDPEVVYGRLRLHTVKDRVPYTVVAFCGAEPIGSCCVIENDCVHRPQYAPWVAAVFVKPEYRKQGVASLFLKEAIRIAALAGVKALYIDCLEVTAPVYAKNGWSLLEREVGDKDSVVMIRRI